MINPFEQMQVPEAPAWLQGVSDTLSDPRTQAAIFSGAAQLAQPLQFGQSQFGHLMASLGQAGQGVRNYDTQRLKEKELDSKQELRSAQAQAAEARAGAAGARSDASATRSAYLADRLKQEGELSKWRMIWKGNSDFQRTREAALKRIKEIDADVLMSAAEKAAAKSQIQVPTWESWTAQNPALSETLRGMGSLDAMGSRSGGAEVRVSTPEEAEALTPGTKYITPDGRRYTR